MFSGESIGTDVTPGQNMMFWGSEEQLTLRPLDLTLMSAFGGSCIGFFCYKSEVSLPPNLSAMFGYLKIFWKD